VTTTTTKPYSAIPQPAGHLLVGNLLDIDGSIPVQSMMKLAQQYGPIVRLALPGRKVTLVSGYDLVNELCDERRFDKMVHAPLQNVRAFAGDGLFTAWTHEPNWHKAHNILLPNFSMKAMQGYLPMMIDIAEQLMLKWERLNPDEPIDVPDDMTRLTLDTIGLCGFNYRFNSFYREEAHPFVGAMVRALGEAMSQLRRLPLQDALMIRAHQQFGSDVAFMNDLVDKIIAERKRAGEGGAADLLGYMLNGVDKTSGTGLDDVNIRHQIITFLIAGHETTSGLLSFALYFLLHNPDVLARAYAEVDRVLGTDPSARPTYAQVQRLTYVQQILKESLRLWPTAPVFALYAREDTLLGGAYPIAKGDQLSVLIPMLHRDPRVWGDDAERFDPDRFAPERERALPPNAFKPFGNGQRACIGRQFAMQEAALVLGMLLQRFELIDHAGYQLKIKETLTLKPDGFTIQVRPRQAGSAARQSAELRASAPDLRPAPAPQAGELPTLADGHQTPLLVLYGSNLGTAEAVAQQLAAEGAARGFAATTAPLDDYAGGLPATGALIVVSASYNGLPPDNAAKFCDWLRGGELSAGTLAGVRYTVFGCGHHDWATTYQAVPALINERLAAFGAQPVYPRGAGDAGDDFDGQLGAWKAGLWPALDAAFGLELGAALPSTPAGPLYTIELAEAREAHPYVAAYGARPLRVLANRELQGAGAERSTRHVELALPDGMTYCTGDHLGVLPHNSAAAVERVLARFGLDGEAQIVIRRAAPGKSHLPLNQPVGLAELLATYVELQEPATRAQIALLAEHTVCPPHVQELRALADEELYRAQILAQRVSALDLLERYPACQLPFNLFLELLPPLRPRYYSISSSPLANARACSLTVGVVAEPARSGRGMYCGVASNYLAGQSEGAVLYGFVRSPNAPFQPPADPRAPMIMVGPGTGLAPFRGFLQERAALKRQGAPVGEALLFFGCRNPEHDFLYADELRGYAAEGVAQLQVACSRVPGQAKAYVQHQIRERQADVWRLLEQGAVVYICGDASRMAPDVRAAFAAIYQAETGATPAVAEEWLIQLAAQGRYLTDVWASS
jgi:cytochrome P450/NADPH-cytochrome P450 reductase